MPDGTDIETLLPLSQRQRRPAGTNLFGFKDFSYICSDGLYLPALLPALPERRQMEIIRRNVGEILGAEQIRIDRSALS